MDFFSDDELDDNEEIDVMKPEEELSEEAKVLNAFRKASFTLPGECEESSEEEEDEKN